MKPKILAIHLGNYLFPIFLLFFMSFLLLFSKTNLLAAREGLQIWANNLVPTLLPFLIATELLSKTDLVQIFGKLLTKWMRPIFNLPGEAGFAFLMGVISGYPVGAKIIANFYHQGICTKEEAERMLPFCNNSGPLFIIATIGTSFYYDSRLGFLLLLTHLFSSLSVGILLGFLSRSKCFRTQESISEKKEVLVRKNRVKDVSLGECILNAIQTILMIGGFLLVFSVLISILQETQLLPKISYFLSLVFSFLRIPTDLATPFLAGIFELTTGLKSISLISLKDMSMNLILSAFILGFGGFCVLLQVYGIISKEKLSIKPYLIGKFLQGSFAAFYTFLLLQSTPLFQFKL